MRLFVVVALGLLALWLFWPRLYPMQPSNQLRTFAQSRADSQMLESARQSGELREDGTRRMLRQALLSAANRLENSPCDKSLQLAFRKATSDLIAYLRKTRDRVETYTIDGHVVDASAIFNAAASDVIREGSMEGILQPDDVAGRPVSSSSHPPPADRSGRYVCTG